MFPPVQTPRYIIDKLHDETQKALKVPAVQEKVDFKLTMLFLFIGTIISLSHHGEEKLVKTKREF